MICEVECVSLRLPRLNVVWGRLARMGAKARRHQVAEAFTDFIKFEVGIYDPWIHRVKGVFYETLLLSLLMDETMDKGAKKKQLQLVLDKVEAVTKEGGSPLVVLTAVKDAVAQEVLSVQG
eukprot:6492070-Amphidinium_carterae.1